MAWLSLQAQESPKPGVKILIPKKIAKLATRRNRLRRLLKEALRLEFALEKNKEYVLRVTQDPGDIGLTQTKEMLHAVWN